MTVGFNTEWKLKESLENHVISCVLARKVLPVSVGFIVGLAYLSTRNEVKEDFNVVLKERINTLSEQITKKNDLLGNFKQVCQTDIWLLEAFEPSKTSKNGLNFVLLKEFENYKDKEAPKIMIDLVKLIYLLAKEPIIEENCLTANLVNCLMPKRKCETIKDLFLGEIVKDLDFSTEEYMKIIEIYEQIGKTFGQDLMKISRGISYISFIFKEVLEYVVGSFKEFKGVRVQDLRRFSKEVEILKEEVASLEKKFIW